MTQAFDHSVGIDDIYLYASTLCIDFAKIANHRKYNDKDLHNANFVRRSVLPSYEDPVTLAVNAAKPIVERAGRDAFDLLIVATETGLDYEKSLSTYVHKYLGLNHRCRAFEVKQACYAGTAALQMACSWLRTEPNKKALIIMTDISRQHFDHVAELALGTGT